MIALFARKEHFINGLPNKSVCNDPDDLFFRPFSILEDSMSDAAVDVSVPEKGASPLRYSSFRPRQMLGVIGGLLIVGLIATAAFTIMRSRNQQLDAAAHELSQLSLTLSEETARTMQSVDLMLTDIQAQLDVAGVIAPDDLRRVAGTQPFYKYLRDKVRDISYIDAVSMIDSTGHVVSTTRS
jgi:hypothetical protein